MLSLPSSQRVIWRTLYVALVAVVMLAQMLPLSAVPAGWPAPEIVLCLTFAWVLRRPDYVPVLLITGVFLLGDALSMRPPGLWTMLVVLGTEFLRSRAVLNRDLPFPVEWMMVGAVIVLMMLAEGLVLSLFLVPHPGIGNALVGALTTLAAYPVVVVLSHWALGLRKAAPGEVDELGHRL